MPAKKPVSPKVAALKVSTEELLKAGVQPPGVALPVAKNGVDVAQGDAGRSQWMEVTPALAQRWLRNNFRNRPVSDDVVTSYARDMAAGQWVATHQGIAFNDRDELIDGQHRLLAVVKSGRTIRMMVTFGLPSKINGKEMTTMDCVDRGRTRSVADQLKIQHGLNNGGQIAAIANALANLCAGERTRRLSVGQTLEVYRTFEAQVNYVIANRSREHGLRTTGVLAAFAFAFAATSEPFDGKGPIAKMFLQLNTGQGLQPKSAILRLREFLTSDEAKLITRSLDRGIAEVSLQAIYMESQGMPCEKLLTVLDGADHYRALQRDRVETIAKLFRLPGKETK